MSLESLLNSLPTGSWLADPQPLLKHQGQTSLFRQESKKLVDDASQALENNSRQTACNLLYVGLLLDEPRFLGSIQQKGLLRISRFSYRPEPLTAIVESLLKPDLALSDNIRAYLQSVVNLYQIAKAVHKDYEAVREWMADEREIGIKGALAWLDLICLKQASGFHETNKTKIDSRHLFFFTVEELASGFSSLLALYAKEFGALRHNSSINTKNAVDGVYLSFLIAGAHFAEFREWEFQIDRMGYHCVATDAANVYELKPPTMEFQRALELGFIQANMQGLIKAQDWYDKDAPTFAKVGAMVASKLKEANLIKELTEPVKRIWFGFPGEALASFVTIKEFFLQEKINLLQASRDLLTPIKTLLDFDLGNGLKFWDLFLVSRLFQLLRSVTAATLVPELEKRPEIALQSLLPTFEREVLVSLIGQAVGDDKASRILDMLVVDIGGHIDIQYQPLLPVGNAIIVPANVFANANVLRNPLAVIRKRLYEDGSIDPLAANLAKQFAEKGFEARLNVEYDEGEVDVLVLIEGTLFVFECKNSLIPTGIHELMTSLDYIRTAAEQLDRFVERFARPEFRKWLSERTGLAVEQCNRVFTGIVMSNRMFMGLRERGHPVRGSYELENFIDSGTIKMGGESHCYWLGTKFAADDLRRYLEEDITYVGRWQSMKPATWKYVFDGCVMLVDRLYLDGFALADHFGFKRAQEGILEQQALYEQAVKEYSLIRQYQKLQKEVDGEGHPANGTDEGQTESR